MIQGRLKVLMITCPTLLWRPVLHVLRYSDPVVRSLGAYKLQQCLIFIRQPWPTTVLVLPARDLQPVVFRGDVGVSFGECATKIHVRGLQRTWLTSKNALRSRAHYTKLIIALFFGHFALQAHTLLLGDFFLSLLVSA